MQDSEIVGWSVDEEDDAVFEGGGGGWSEERILIPPFMWESAVAWWPLRISK